MSFDIWLAYFGACWLISLSPGAGAVASMAAGLTQGFWRGYWVVLGLQLGLALQLLIVALGVGALLTTSALAFAIIKWGGVAYLVYLAVQQWRSAPTQNPSDTPASSSDQRNPAALLLRGFMVNASNPKAIIFLLAVLPQFLQPAQPLAPQYLIMGITLIGVDLLVMAGYVALANRVLTHLRDPRQRCWLQRGFASAFAAAAIALASFRRAVS